MLFESCSGQIFVTALVCSCLRRQLLVVSEGASVKTVKRLVPLCLKFEGMKKATVMVLEKLYRAICCVRAN